MDDKNCLIWTHGRFSFRENRIWFVPYRGNVLCSYNVISQCVDQVVKFQNITTSVSGFFTTFSLGDQIIVVPAIEDKIFTYNLGTQRLVENNIIRNEGFESFDVVEVYGGKAYVFPVNNPYYLKIEVDNDSLIISKYVCKYQLILSSVRIANKVYFVMKDNRIAVFHLHDERFDVVYSNSDRIKYRNIISLYNHKIIVIDMDGIGYLFDVNNLESGGKKVFEAGEEIWSVSSYGDDVYLFPKESEEKFIVIDTIAWKKNEILINRDKYFKEWGGPAYSEPIIDGSNIYIMNTRQQALLRIDCNNKSVEKNYIYWNEKFKDSEKQLLKILLNGKNVSLINEGDQPYNRLYSFIDAIIEE